MGREFITGVWKTNIAHSVALIYLTMKTKAIIPTEHQTQTAIIQYLRTKDWYVMRLNSGKYSVGEGRSKRFIMGQDAGTPDVLAFKQQLYRVSPAHILMAKDTVLLFIEVKRPGNKPTSLQAAKMDELREYGAKCIVATCIEDLEAYGL